MDSISNLWNYVEYVESTWNLWGSVKYMVPLRSAIYEHRQIFFFMRHPLWELRS